MTALSAGPDGSSVSFPYDPAIARRAYAGQLTQATRLATRRLRASGLPPMTEAGGGPPDLGRRVAAALLFPLSDEDAQTFAEAVTRPRTADVVAS